MTNIHKKTTTTMKLNRFIIHVIMLNYLKENTGTVDPNNLGKL